MSMPTHPWRITIFPAKDGTVRIRTRCHLDDVEARCFARYVEKALVVLRTAGVQ
jgi:hypothetical protein